MDENSEHTMKQVLLRFTPGEWEELTKSLNPRKKVSPQIKDIIFEKVAVKRPEKITAALPDYRLETMLLRERLEKLTTLMSVFLQKVDAQDNFIETIAKDAARTKLVVENIQNYLAQEGEGD